MSKPEFNEHQTDPEQWTREAVGLTDNRVVFEPWCGECMRALGDDEEITYEQKDRFGVEPGLCDCKEPTHIFVGKSTADACAWDAAGILLELVQRAVVIIKAQGDELDKAYANEVRTEEALTKLREQINELRAMVGDETASEAFAAAHNDTVKKC